MCWKFFFLQCTIHQQKCVKKCSFSSIRSPEVVYSEMKRKLTNVIGMCSTDITSSNTGWNIGACTLLQSNFVKEELIYFPCRNRVFEVVLSEVFLVSFGKSTGPEIPMFLQFWDKWNTFEVESEIHGLTHTAFSSTFTKRMRTETIECIQNYLSENSRYIPREDYRELCDPTLLILGVKNKNYRFRLPEALHHAQWMCKIIYPFKIYLFPNQLK